MVSDSELVRRLRDFLRTSDLNTTTTGAVRRRLEEDFGVDLSGKKAFIREQVDLFLQSEVGGAEEAERDEGEGEVEEEDQKPEQEESEGSGSKEEEEGEEEIEDEEESDAKSSGRKGRPEKPNKGVRRGGFTKLCSLSPLLQSFTGKPEMSRTEVVKQLWAYIKEKQLQDPSNRRNVICDEALRPIFKVDSINMFQMNKALAKHIWPLENENGSTNSMPKRKPKEKKPKQESEDSEDEAKQKVKRQKRGNPGFLAPLPLSDALVKFLGTGESALSRSEVTKRIWEYIKQNNLQDPSDKRRIICDEKLKELLDVDSFNGFSVSKLLCSHFVKTEE